MSKEGRSNWVRGKVGNVGVSESVIRRGVSGKGSKLVREERGREGFLGGIPVTVDLVYIL